jgi:hypothetical protein
MRDFESFGPSLGLLDAGVAAPPEFFLCAETLVPVRYAASFLFHRFE